jgi:hypothetical protein
MVKKPDNLTDEFVFDHIEGDQAVLISGDKKCVIPKSFLPNGIALGDIVHTSFSSAEDENQKRDKSAKDILNEILNV